MTGWAWTFLVLFVSTASFLVFMTRRALFLSETLERILPELARNFDVLNIVFRNIEHKSKLDVFSDEPVVRDLVEDIKAAKLTVFVTLNTARDFLEEQDYSLPLNNEENVDNIDK